MGTYHQVVLRDRSGNYVVRVSPGDYGFSVKAERAGGRFDTVVLPKAIAAAEACTGRTLTAIWVDDASGDGWDSVACGASAPVVPWDGPASLYEEPELPYAVPAERDTTVAEARGLLAIRFVRR